MNKKIIILGAIGLGLLGAAAYFGLGDWGTTALWAASRQGQWLLPLVLVAAVIDSINPCAFGLLLLTIGFLLSLGKTRASIIKIGGVYVAGVMTAYFLIGLGIWQALHLFSTPHLMGKLGALVLLLWGGLNLINALWPSFPIKLKVPQLAHHRIASLLKRVTLPATFALGALVGLCEFPCTGGPYLMVIGLLKDTATYWRGVGYLILYNIVFVLPLVIILTLASQKNLLSKIEAWKKHQTPALRIGGGLAMMALGAVILLIS